MPASDTTLKTFDNLSPRAIIDWRIFQSIVWLIGLSIFLCLIFSPHVGLLAFWNVLIPVAPALLVVACGIWRNVCPLATTNLLARHFNLSKRKMMPVALQAKLQLSAIIALYLIVPLRHLLFNTDAQATAFLLFFMVVLSISMGLVYDWKSGWCNSLCPVHPVEKLYGGNTLFSLPNAHCDKCVKCSVPCPDSTPNFHPSMSRKTVYNRLSGLLTIGGLPGFIFGWFHVPDYSGTPKISNLFEAYGLPFLGFCISMLIYLFLKRFFGKKNGRMLISCFAAAGVSCYYWFRIPALLGFGKFASDGALFNLKNVMPAWIIILMVLSETVFFFWWLVIRDPNHKSWVIRPKYAPKKSLSSAQDS